MESNFSATLRLTDLNDFIAPSQACVKPPEQTDEVGIHSKKKVEITLGDCLACSGCITSAETILIQQQSHEEVYRILRGQNEPEQGRKIVAVSLSHQAIASIAAKYSLNFQDAAEKLCSYFKRLGVHKVFDLTLARHLSLNESICEFAQHFEHNRSLPAMQRAPLLCSVCPGFVCYVEKTHSQLVPILSQVKSSQQIQGHLLKHVWSKRVNIPTKSVYHITLMPCFDKKLEASRKEFIFDELKDVDCVITPIELELMFEKESINFDSLPNAELDLLMDKQQAEIGARTQIASHIGSGSGGYAEILYRTALSGLFSQSISSNEPLQYESKRNKDFLEIHLQDPKQSKPLLSVAIVNGFRNIQTIVQRQKRKTLHFDYIEVMACPSGCLNGGGMLRNVSLEQVEQTYRQSPALHVEWQKAMEDHRRMCQELFGQEEQEQKKALRTTFNIIPKMENVLNINW